MTKSEITERIQTKIILFKKEYAGMLESQEHDRWFRSQIKEALIVADNPVTEFTPHETVHSRWTDKKKSLQALAKNKRS
jgi:hypothetical protein